MPTYEYRCDNGHTFEVLQAMSDQALDSCEVCGAPARRILFAPAVHFKGSGFYTTDYARKGAKANGADGSKPESADAGKKGSESKSGSGDTGGTSGGDSSSSSSSSDSSGPSGSSGSGGSGDKAASGKD